MSTSLPVYFDLRVLTDNLWVKISTDVHSSFFENICTSAFSRFWGLNRILCWFYVFKNLCFDVFILCVNKLVTFIFLNNDHIIILMLQTTIKQARNVLKVSVLPKTIEIYYWLSSLLL